jgi:hypothetical protein
MNRSRYWDINVSCRDFGSEDDGQASTAAPMTLNPALYVLESDRGEYKIYTGIMYECSNAEALVIRELRSEMEYGNDFWEFIDHLYELNISSSINNWLDDLPYPESINLEGIDGYFDVKASSDLPKLMG